MNAICDHRTIEKAVMLEPPSSSVSLTPARKGRRHSSRRTCQGRISKSSPLGGRARAREQAKETVSRLGLFVTRLSYSSCELTRSLLVLRKPCLVLPTRSLWSSCTWKAVVGALAVLLAINTSSRSFHPCDHGKRRNIALKQAFITTSWRIPLSLTHTEVVEPEPSLWTTASSHFALSFSPFKSFLPHKRWI